MTAARSCSVGSTRQSSGYSGAHLLARPTQTATCGKSSPLATPKIKPETRRYRSAFPPSHSAPCYYPKSIGLMMALGALYAMFFAAMVVVFVAWEALSWLGRLIALEH
jgi:hypothetical protein